jgi:hypothetical protein
VAHQHARDLFLLALLLNHPNPDVVVRKFRKLVDDLTWDSESPDDQSYLALVRRSAAAFDRMTSDLLIATKTETQTTNAHARPLGASAYAARTDPTAAVD